MEKNEFLQWSDPVSMATYLSLYFPHLIWGGHMSQFETPYSVWLKHTNPSNNTAILNVNDSDWMLN